MPLLRTSINRLKRTSTHRVADVGIIQLMSKLTVALLGQSNMADMFNDGAYYPLSDLQTRHFRSGVWAHIGNYDDGTNTNPELGSTASGRPYTSVYPATVGDSEVVFANYLRLGMGVPIDVLPYAAGGTTIQQWQPSGGDAWAGFAAALIASGADMQSTLWLQGEENALYGTSGPAYQAFLLNILNGLKSATGRDSSNFKFGVISLGPGTTYAPEGNMGVIRAAHLDFVAAHSSDGAYLAACAHDMDLGTSNIHFYNHIRMAKRYVKGLLHQYGKADYGAQGPKISSATRSGSVVTVHIAQNGGTSLADGAGGSGSALLGFRVYDSGSLCAISSTAISGNTVALTLSATPAGSVTMDYAMANAPYGATTAPASVVYDNDTVPGDTLGLPLQPHALMAVT